MSHLLSEHSSFMEHIVKSESKTKNIKCLIKAVSTELIDTFGNSVGVIRSELCEID